MGQLVLKGAITDGPGDAGNPLILRNYQDGLTVANPQNTYAGPTISTYTGGEEGGGQRWGIVFVAPESQLGKGDLLIEPGGQVRLAVPTKPGRGRRGFGWGQRRGGRGSGRGLQRRTQAQRRFLRRAGGGVR